LNADHLATQASASLSGRIWTLVAVVSVLIVVLVVLHVYLAYRLSVAFMLAYVTALFVIAGGILALYALVASSRVFYIHHWFIFWLLALFTRFNHPLSAAALGLCTGIFVQGAAAYGAATVAFV
jgi:hypothetical protein